MWLRGDKHHHAKTSAIRHGKTGSYRPAYQALRPPCFRQQTLAGLRNTCRRHADLYALQIRHHLDADDLCLVGIPAPRSSFAPGGDFALDGSEGGDGGRHSRSLRRPESPTVHQDTHAPGRSALVPASDLHLRCPGSTRHLHVDVEPPAQWQSGG